MTPDRLRQLLSYDPKTGILTWRVTVAQRSRAGTAAGRTRSKGRRYSAVMVDGKRIAAHRIAWALHYGEWPDKFIDHIDGDGFNNRISNLRLATRSQNGANRPGWTKKVSGLPKGVTTMGNNYRARIISDGNVFYLGCFKTPEEASQAYAKAAAKLHGEFART